VRYLLSLLLLLLLLFFFILNSYLYCLAFLIIIIFNVFIICISFDVYVIYGNFVLLNKRTYHFNTIHFNRHLWKWNKCVDTCIAIETIFKLSSSYLNIEYILILFIKKKNVISNITIYRYTNTYCEDAR